MNASTVVWVLPWLTSCAPADHNVFHQNQFIHRWSITDDSGTTLAQGCASWWDAGTRETGNYDPSYWAKRIQVAAAAGTVLIVEDNFGTEEVDKYIVDPTPMPTTNDDFWCGSEGDASRSKNPTLGLECYQVVDPNPPATLENLELVNPSASPFDSGAALAEGFRARFRVQHAGVVTLSRNLDSCFQEDAGGTDTYSLFTILTP